MSLMDLSDYHRPLFIEELRAAIDGDFTELVCLIEGWEATADLDADPDLAAVIRAPGQYTPLDLPERDGGSPS